MRMLAFEAGACFLTIVVKPSSIYEMSNDVDVMKSDQRLDFCYGVKFMIMPKV